MPNPSVEKVINRIRKLNRLAESSNEHEAAAAAAEAARLMQEHQLEEAQLIAIDEVQDEPVLPDNLIDSIEGTRVCNWRACVANAVAKSLGCTFWTNKVRNALTRKVEVHSRVIGRRSDAQAVDYLYRAICNQIDQLAQKAWDAYGPMAPYGVTPRGWKSSFRTGASHTVYWRLEEQTKAAAVTRSELPSGTGTALMVINNRANAVAKIEKQLGLRTRKATLNVTVPEGYAAGRAAGAEVSLSNQGARALGKPSKEISR